MTTTNTAAQLARRLYRDDLSRADEVPVQRDGHKAYDGWLEGSSDACDRDTVEALESVDRDEFAAAWEALVNERASEKLQAAIDRSVSHDEIVTLRLSDLGDTQDAVLSLLSNLAGDLESDYVVNGDTIEFWAWRDDSTDPQEMEWRIHLDRR